MSTFAISISFTTNCKNHDKAYALAEQIGALVEAEKLSTDYTVIDVELLDEEDDNTIDELDFGDDE